MTVKETLVFHVGRSWGGPGWIESSDECTCDKAPCGLVVMNTINSDCSQHSQRTLRTNHPAEECEKASEAWMKRE